MEKVATAAGFLVEACGEGTKQRELGKTEGWLKISYRTVPILRKGTYSHSWDTHGEIQKKTSQGGMENDRRGKKNTTSSKIEPHRGTTMLCETKARTPKKGHGMGEHETN